ncbi:MAG: chondroitinase-B domain-containing protein [Mucilaginibacter sp.]|uniref:chondroitinase-B domain-containing protein n=1 Tax=Mucilaginibacter sp. TaxID=1882438 RepID=UPI0032660C52
MKKLFITALLILGANAAICKNYLIHNEQEFNTISAQLKAGDNVTIANGIYTPWSITINTAGTAAKPITIQAQTVGKVTFTGDTDHPIFQLTGAYTVLSGITFTGCNILKADKKEGVLVDLFNSKHCRLTNCTFTKNTAKSQFMPIVMISGTGEYNQVDHCTFCENIDNQEVQIRILKQSSPQYSMVNNNIFKNKDHVSWKNFNGGECVQIGQDPILLGLSISKTTVRENTFIRCNGEPEVISNKSSQNIIAKNYFEDCEGELVMRGGHDCLIDSNTIKGSSCGIRVNGTGHTITHNNISNVKTGIRLMYGMAKGKAEIGFYIAASDCVIKNNHIENCTTGILIGDSKNADWTGKFDTNRYPSRVMQDVAPYNNTLGDNVFIGVGKNVIEQ